jgi:hypothetical protein
MRRALIAMSLVLLARLPALAAQDSIIDHPPTAADATSDLTLALNRARAVIFPAAVQMVAVKLADASVGKSAAPPIYLLPNSTDDTNFIVVGANVGSDNLVGTDGSGKQTIIHVTVERYNGCGPQCSFATPRGSSE